MLETKLKEQENNNSLFETAIRKLNITVSNYFIDSDNKIVNCDFTQKDFDIKEIADKKAIEENFTKTSNNHKNKILLGKVTQEINKKSGINCAVMFSGGPAAGGHNVIAGLFQILSKGNKLFGVKGGPAGLIAGNFFEIKADAVKKIINTGGFDFLGSDRTKIKTEEQFLKVKEALKENKINALVIVGGDDSNTNAALLAEYLYDDGILVIGVPKTIDGDLQIGSVLPISFGFDTATKIYAEMVGNILQDTPSSRKYWHFIKLMGRSASHVTLETALLTKPALTFISEEVEAKNMSLDDIIENITEVILKRVAKGIKHGVIIIPEGLVEFIPEMKLLIAELNEVIAKFDLELNQLEADRRRDFVYKKISANNVKLMASLPDEFEDMLLLDRDAHGNLQVSQIPTEKLLIQMTEERIKERQNHPEELSRYSFSDQEKELILKYKFAYNNHFLGYEGRCGAPSLFDASYTFNLGLVAASLILSNKTGYMACLSNLEKEGLPMAVPLSAMLNIEKRHACQEFVIAKALVELNSNAFKFFEARRALWAEKDCFNSPGPRQMWGPVAKQLPLTVVLNQAYNGLEFSFGKDIII